MTSPDAVDPVLLRDMGALAPAGLLIGHRLISPGDEDTLLNTEIASMSSSVVAARRASGAARIVARTLLAQLGHARAALPKSASGAPVWPAGITGSLAHDDQVAVAAVGRQRDVGAVGIDVEPALALPSETLDLVATRRERQDMNGDALGGRLLFAAKEAVYKAVHPLDGVFLEFHDIEVDRAAGKARTRTGREVALRYCVSSHVVVLALSEA